MTVLADGDDTITRTISLNIVAMVMSMNSNAKKYRQWKAFPISLKYENHRKEKLRENVSIGEAQGKERQGRMYEKHWQRLFYLVKR